MTDTITAPEVAPKAEPDTAAAIVAAELDRITASGATLDNPYAFSTGATPITQALLDSVRGFGLRPKPAVAERVHAALGRVAVAALTKAEPLGRDFWWEDYGKDTLMGHLVDRLRKRSDCSFSSPVLKAAFTAAAGVLTDDAFDAEPVSVRAEDRALLLAIGSHATLADLTDANAAKGLSTEEVQAAVDGMVADGVLYRRIYFGSPTSYRPTPAGAVVLKQLQDEREARRKAEEAKRQERRKALAAKRDAAVDELVPDLAEAHTAVRSAYVDLTDAWDHLASCDRVDLPVAVEGLDQAQSRAHDAASNWTTIIERLHRLLAGQTGDLWPAGGRDRAAAALGELGIALDANLDGSAQRHPKALLDLIDYQNEHLPDVVLAGCSQHTEAAVVEPAPARAGTGASAEDTERLVRTWRLIALVAAIAAITAPALAALVMG